MVHSEYVLIAAVVVEEVRHCLHLVEEECVLVDIMTQGDISPIVLFSNIDSYGEP